MPGGRRGAANITGDKARRIAVNMAHGRMIGGFAMVAYPYQYGNSGVMTFLVNHDGEVYSKDLGPNSKKIASSMKRFDPDSTWKKEENVDEDAPKPQ